MKTQEDSISVRDESGVLVITYADMLKYHGQDFFGGVALAFKVLKLAFEKLVGSEVPHRDEIRLVVGFNPPGVMDGLEMVTRAVTRKRFILDPDPQKGPESVFGRYCFEVCYRQRSVILSLKPGLLPKEFTALARKAFAGIAQPDELMRWKKYKEEIGRNLMAMAPEEILDIEGPWTLPSVSSRSSGR